MLGGKYWHRCFISWIIVIILFKTYDLNGKNYRGWHNLDEGCCRWSIWLSLTYSVFYVCGLEESPVNLDFCSIKYTLASSQLMRIDAIDVTSSHWLTNRSTRDRKRALVARIIFDCQPNHPPHTNLTEHISHSYAWQCCTCILTASVVVHCIYDNRHW